MLLVTPDCDDKEGVGTVNAYAAYNCVKNGWTWKEYKRLNWYGGPTLPYPAILAERNY
jgi:hypothetical protein